MTPRYIDADMYIKYCDEHWIPLNVDAVKAQPTADVVEVVRCKYCKWWNIEYSLTGEEYKVCRNEIYGTELFVPIRSEEDFCSGGKRRDT